MGYGVVGAQAFSNDAVAGTKVEVKAAPAKLFLLRLLNTTQSAAYLQVFDKPAAQVTVGTTAPLFFVRLASEQDLVVAFHCPVDLGEGFTIAGTTTAGGASGAAISVTAVFQ